MFEQDENSWNSFEELKKNSICEQDEYKLGDEPENHNLIWEED